MKRSLYFENRRLYYQLKEAGRPFQIQVETIYKKYKTYFINFEIMESRGYVVGSLSSGKKIPLNIGKSIIKANLPLGYTAINFYEAVENERQIGTKFVLMREGEEIWEGSLNV